MKPIQELEEDIRKLMEKKLIDLKQVEIKSQEKKINILKSTQEITEKFSTEIQKSMEGIHNKTLSNIKKSEDRMQIIKEKCKDIKENYTINDRTEVIDIHSRELTFSLLKKEKSIEKAIEQERIELKNINMLKRRNLNNINDIKEKKMKVINNQEEIDIKNKTELSIILIANKAKCCRALIEKQTEHSISINNINEQKFIQIASNKRISDEYEANNKQKIEQETADFMQNLAMGKIDNKAHNYIMLSIAKEEHEIEKSKESERAIVTAFKIKANSFVSERDTLNNNIFKDINLIAENNKQEILTDEKYGIEEIYLKAEYRMIEDKIKEMEVTQDESMQTEDKSTQTEDAPKVNTLLSYATTSTSRRASI